MTNEATDIHFMKNPANWPLWPVLPLKRSGQPRQELGFLVAEEVLIDTPRVFRVFVGYIYDLQTKTLAEFEKIDYPNAEAVSADGWIVD